MTSQMSEEVDSAVEGLLSLASGHERYPDLTTLDVSQLGDGGHLSTFPCYAQRRSRPRTRSSARGSSTDDYEYEVDTGQKTPSCTVCLKNKPGKDDVRVSRPSTPQKMKTASRKASTPEKQKTTSRRVSSSSPQKLNMTSKKVSTPEKLKITLRKVSSSSPEKRKTTSRRVSSSSPQKLKMTSKTASTPKKLKTTKASATEKLKTTSKRVSSSSPEKLKMTSKKTSNLEKLKTTSRRVSSSSPEKWKTTSKRASSSSPEKLKMTSKKSSTPKKLKTASEKAPATEKLKTTSKKVSALEKVKNKSKKASATEKLNSTTRTVSVTEKLKTASRGDSTTEQLKTTKRKSSSSALEKLTTTPRKGHSYRCRFCTFCTKDRDAKQEHDKSCRPHRCKYCYRHFATLDECKEHLVSCAEDHQYECLLCNRTLLRARRKMHVHSLQHQHSLHVIHKMVSYPQYYTESVPCESGNLCIICQPNLSKYEQIQALLPCGHLAEENEGVDEGKVCSPRPAALCAFDLSLQRDACDSSASKATVSENDTHVDSLNDGHDDDGVNGDTSNFDDLCLFGERAACVENNDTNCASYVVGTSLGKSSNLRSKSSKSSCHSDPSGVHADQSAPSGIDTADQSDPTGFHCKPSCQSDPIGSDETDPSDPSGIAEADALLPTSAGFTSAAVGGKVFHDAAVNTDDSLLRAATTAQENDFCRVVSRLLFSDGADPTGLLECGLLGNTSVDTNTDTLVVNNCPNVTVTTNMLPSFSMNANFGVDPGITRNMNTTQEDTNLNLNMSTFLSESSILNASMLLNDASFVNALLDDRNMSVNTSFVPCLNTNTNVTPLISIRECSDDALFDDKNMSANTNFMPSLNTNVTPLIGISECSNDMPFDDRNLSANTNFVPNLNTELNVTPLIPISDSIFLCNVSVPLPSAISLPSISSLDLNFLCEESAPLAPAVSTPVVSASDSSLLCSESLSPLSTPAMSTPVICFGDSSFCCDFNIPAMSFDASIRDLSFACEEITPVITPAVSTPATTTNGDFSFACGDITAVAPAVATSATPSNSVLNFPSVSVTPAASLPVASPAAHLGSPMTLLECLALGEDLQMQSVRLREERVCTQIGESSTTTEKGTSGELPEDAIPATECSENTTLTTEHSENAIPVSEHSENTNAEHLENTTGTKHSENTASPTEHSENTNPATEHSENSALTTEHSENITPTTERSENTALTTEHSENATPTTEHSVNTTEHSEIAVPASETSENTTPTPQHSENTVPTTEHLENTAHTTEHVDNTTTATELSENTTPTTEHLENTTIAKHLESTTTEHSENTITEHSENPTAEHSENTITEHSENTTAATEQSTNTTKHSENTTPTAEHSENTIAEHSENTTSEHLENTTTEHLENTTPERNAETNMTEKTSEKADSTFSVYANGEWLISFECGPSEKEKSDARSASDDSVSKNGDSESGCPVDDMKTALDKSKTDNSVSKNGDSESGCHFDDVKTASDKSKSDDSVSKNVDSESGCHFDVASEMPKSDDSVSKNGDFKSGRHFDFACCKEDNMENDSVCVVGCIRDGDHVESIEGESVDDGSSDNLIPPAKSSELGPAPNCCTTSAPVSPVKSLEFGTVTSPKSLEFWTVTSPNCRTANTPILPSQRTPTHPPCNLSAMSTPNCCTASVHVSPSRHTSVKSWELVTLTSPDCRTATTPVSPSLHIPVNSSELGPTSLTVSTTVSPSRHAPVKSLELGTVMSPSCCTASATVCPSQHIPVNSSELGATCLTVSTTISPSQRTSVKSWELVTLTAPDCQTATTPVSPSLHIPVNSSELGSTCLTVSTTISPNQHTPTLTAASNPISPSHHTPVNSSRLGSTSLTVSTTISPNRHTPTHPSCDGTPTFTTNCQLGSGHSSEATVSVLGSPENLTSGHCSEATVSAAGSPYYLTAASSPTCLSNATTPRGHTAVTNRIDDSAERVPSCHSAANPTGESAETVPTFHTCLNLASNAMFASYKPGNATPPSAADVSTVASGGQNISVKSDSCLDTVLTPPADQPDSKTSEDIEQSEYKPPAISQRTTDSLNGIDKSVSENRRDALDTIVAEQPDSKTSEDVDESTLDIVSAESQRTSDSCSDGVDKPVGIPDSSRRDADLDTIVAEQLDSRTSKDIDTSASDIVSAESQRTTDSCSDGVDKSVDIPGSSRRDANLDITVAELPDSKRSEDIDTSSSDIVSAKSQRTTDSCSNGVDKSVDIPYSSRRGVDLDTIVAELLDSKTSKVIDTSVLEIVSAESQRTTDSCSDGVDKSVDVPDSSRRDADLDTIIAEQPDSKTSKDIDTSAMEIISAESQRTTDSCSDGVDKSVDVPDSSRRDADLDTIVAEQLDSKTSKDIDTSALEIVSAESQRTTDSCSDGVDKSVDIPDSSRRETDLDTIVAEQLDSKTSKDTSSIDILLEPPEIYQRTTDSLSNGIEKSVDIPDSNTTNRKDALDTIITLEVQPDSKTSQDIDESASDIVSQRTTDSLDGVEKPVDIADSDGEEVACLMDLIDQCESLTGSCSPLLNLMDLIEHCDLTACSAELGEDVENFDITNLCDGDSGKDEDGDDAGEGGSREEDNFKLSSSVKDERAKKSCTKDLTRISRHNKDCSFISRRKSGDSGFAEDSFGEASNDRNAGVHYFTRSTLAKIAADSQSAKTNSSNSSTNTSPKAEDLPTCKVLLSRKEICQSDVDDKNVYKVNTPKRPGPGRPKKRSPSCASPIVLRSNVQTQSPKATTTVQTDCIDSSQQGTKSLGLADSGKQAKKRGRKPKRKIRLDVHHQALPLKRVGRPLSISSHNTDEPLSKKKKLLVSVDSHNKGRNHKISSSQARKPIVLTISKNKTKVGSKLGEWNARRKRGRRPLQKNDTETYATKLGEWKARRGRKRGRRPLQKNYTETHGVTTKMAREPLTVVNSEKSTEESDSDCVITAVEQSDRMNSKTAALRLKQEINDNYKALSESHAVSSKQCCSAFARSSTVASSRVLHPSAVRSCSDIPHSNSSDSLSRKRVSDVHEGEPPSKRLCPDESTESKHVATIRFNQEKLMSVVQKVLQSHKKRSSSDTSCTSQRPAKRVCLQDTACSAPSACSLHTRDLDRRDLASRDLDRCDLDRHDLASRDLDRHDLPSRDFDRHDLPSHDLDPSGALDVCCQPPPCPSTASLLSHKPLTIIARNMDLIRRRHLTSQWERKTSDNTHAEKSGFWPAFPNSCQSRFEGYVSKQTPQLRQNQFVATSRSRVPTATVTGPEQQARVCSSSVASQNAWASSQTPTSLGQQVSTERKATSTNALLDRDSLRAAASNLRGVFSSAANSLRRVSSAPVANSSHRVYSSSSANSLPRVSLDISLNRVSSTNSLHRVCDPNSVHRISSDNSLHRVPSSSAVNSLPRVSSANSLPRVSSANSLHRSCSASSLRRVSSFSAVNGLHRSSLMASANGPLQQKNCCSSSSTRSSPATPVPVSLFTNVRSAGNSLYTWYTCVGRTPTSSVTESRSAYLGGNMKSVCGAPSRRSEETPTGRRPDTFAPSGTPGLSASSSRETFGQSAADSQSFLPQSADRSRSFVVLAKGNGFSIVPEDEYKESRNASIPTFVFQKDKPTKVFF